MDDAAGRHPPHSSGHTLYVLARKPLEIPSRSVPCADRRPCRHDRGFHYRHRNRLDVSSAISWTVLLWSWLSIRIEPADRRRIAKLLILPLMAFPWLLLDAQAVGWWFKAFWQLGSWRILLSYRVPCGPGRNQAADTGPAC